MFGKLRTQALAHKDKNDVLSAVYQALTGVTNLHSDSVRRCHDDHFQKGETEAQRRCGTCSRSHGQLVAETGSKSNLNITDYCTTSEISTSNVPLLGYTCILLVHFLSVFNGVLRVEPGFG